MKLNVDELLNEWKNKKLAENARKLLKKNKTNTSKQPSQWLRGKAMKNA